MSGGKGGSTSSTVEIPQYIEDAAKRNLARADTISQIGYVPYYGADVAAFTPMQEAAFQNTAGTAGAFGLAGGGMSQQDITGGMPAPTTYAGGVRGYSSAPMYEQAMDELATRRPGQKNLIDSLFIDPYSGVAGANVGPMVDYTDTRIPGDLGGGSVGGGGDGGSVYFPETIRGTPTAPTDGTVYTSTDFAGNEVPYTIVTPTDVRPPGYIDNTPSTFPEQRQYYDSSPMLPGGPAVMHSSDGTSTNLGYDLGPSVAGGRGTIVPGQTTIPPAPATTLTDKFLQSITGPVKENKVTSYSHATDNDREFDAFYDTKVKDPLSGKMLSPFQLSNRLQPGSLGAQYADMGITSLGQILDPTPPPLPQVIKN